MTAIGVKQLFKKGQAIWAHSFTISTAKTQSEENIPAAIQQVLKEFPDVFAEPKTLPLRRNHDHFIPLKSEANPVSIRPYRYNFFQKNEIEKQVNEMHQNGIIQPSHSLFSSPVLLVKKKDGYYRRFIKSYGVISRPLTNLLKKNGFLWDDDSEAAFQALKEAMTTAPVLALADFNEHFVIETDACSSGMGAVRMQQGRPIAIFNKALAPRHMGLCLPMRRSIWLFFQL
ncbi:PREDICTED: uncharacterized protein LOC109217806 [Nicotiana attenuata]|uniref:uncharacterized protein LOC109217806 n=1 Tax=Nicotiana attenuata TaxID=49451 RepID=UPI0009049101|nr:PREDICTED: uncharacterized protein LOC109217806 [Nicotiana attenuata]